MPSLVGQEIGPIGYGLMGEHLNLILSSSHSIQKHNTNIYPQV